MWIDHLIAARHHEAAETARQMLAVAERRKSTAILADAHHALGCTLFWRGHHDDALTAINRAIVLCPDGAGRISFNVPDPLVESLAYAAVGTWTIGYPDRAVDLLESAAKRSRDVNQPLSLAFALFYQTWVCSWRGEILATQRVCEQLEALAEEGGFASYFALNRIHQGWVAGMQGEHERGIALIRSGIANWAPLGFTYFRSILAEACLRAGRYLEAMDAVAASREHAGRTGEHFAEPEIERVAGEALILMGAENAAEAEQCVRRAIAIATEQGAKSWELRATTSLARLLASQGRSDEAHTMLAEIYGWFTEGFDTADLKDAKALLEQLNG
jgi:predicted ATPase